MQVALKLRVSPSFLDAVFDLRSENIDQMQ